MWCAVLEREIKHPGNSVIIVTRQSEYFPPPHLTPVHCLSNGPESSSSDTSPFAPTQPNNRSSDIDPLDSEAQNGSGPGDDTSRQISDDTVAETEGSDEELARQLDSESVRSRGGSSGRSLPGAPHSADGGSVFGMYGGHINFSNCKFKEVILMTFDARRFGDQTRKLE